MKEEKNILKWYPFEKGSSILEIYSQNSIFDTIENKEYNVKSCRYLNIESNLNEKYDYITLIGTFEYAPVIYNVEKSYSYFLKKLKEHLKDNGKILLAIDNRLGIKYFAGAKNEIYDEIFEGLESEIRQKQSNLLLKVELEKYIKEAEFQFYKFYYPLPDYRLTTTIFTDKFIPKSNHSKIVYPVNYENDSVIVFNEINVIKQLCDSNRFCDFTNSYFVEIANNLITNDIKFVNYNFFRKADYKLILKIRENSVEKIPECEQALKHVENIEKYIKNLKELGFNVLENIENDVIKSPYIDSYELDKILVNLVKENKVDQFYNKIDDWILYLKQRLLKIENVENDIFEKYGITLEKEVKDKMYFIKDGYIDLSFENVFYINDNEYTLYDQEWYLENIPIEYIIYRSINNLYMYNEKSLITKIKKEDIIKKYNLDIYESCFQKLEQNIQNEILDIERVNEYKNNISNCTVSLAKIQNDNQKMKEKIKIIEDEKNEIEYKYSDLLTQHNELLNEYNNSRGWKLIKTTRRLLRRKKNEKK